MELNSNPEVPRKFPRLPRRFPGLPRRFPVSLGSLTPSSDSQKLAIQNFPNFKSLFLIRRVGCKCHEVKRFGALRSWFTCPHFSPKARKPFCTAFRRFGQEQNFARLKALRDGHQTIANLKIYAFFERALNPYILNQNISNLHFSAQGAVLSARSLSRRCFPCGIALERAVENRLVECELQCEIHFFKCPPLECPPLRPPELSVKRKTWL